jgi:hypothetical protein
MRPASNSFLRMQESDMTLRKTDKGYKIICMNSYKILWFICEFMKRSICLSNLGANIIAIQCSKKTTVKARRGGKYR